MKWFQTRTAVHTPGAARQQARDGRASAMRLTASAQILAQLLLWVTFYGYDRALQTIWQAALMLAVPFAALWFLWRQGEQAVESRAGAYWALPLMLCLLSDAALMLYVLCGYIDALIPEYAYPVGAVAVAAVCWLTLLLSRRDGVAYGTKVLRIPFILLFLLGTVVLRTSSRADRLWPILGQGFFNTAMAALPGCGAVWGCALLFLLPGKSAQPSPLRRSGYAFVPWVMGVLWALWYGFMRPWARGDALDVGERLMGLARHADSVINYQLAGLMWLVLLPVALTGCALGGEIILCRAVPKCPRALAGGAVIGLALALVLIWPAQLPSVLEMVLPWRTAVSVVCAVGMWAAGGRVSLRKRGAQRSNS